MAQRKKIKLPGVFSAHLFSWDNVPGDDSKRLLKFLLHGLNIDWAEDAEISKSDDGRTIRISKYENYAEIIIDDAKKKATLRISDAEKTHDLKVKEMKDGKLHIYPSSMSTHIAEKVLDRLSLEVVIQDWFKRKRVAKKWPVVTLVFLVLFFVLSAVFYGLVEEVVVPKLIDLTSGPNADIIKPTKIRHSLTTDDGGYIHIWEPCTSRRAPDKGWLIAENPFYKICINLDHGYYLIEDKERDKDILVYDDTVKNAIDMLTGCDLGFGDHDGDNPIQYATTALHDTDGIEYELSYEDRDNGFVLIDTRGWDTRHKDAGKGYDVEAEVAFGIFANEPYFINAVEHTNLQRLGCAAPKPFMDPDEIVQSWVIIDEYRYTSMKGGDNSNSDLWGPPILYNLTPISSTERKPWHIGSASFSLMFPDHILLGDKFGGAIIFSLPEGIFRFDDRLGVYGDQIAGEFIINVDTPQEAIVFSVNPVNELLFFYDFVEFNTIAGYNDLMMRTCERYNLECPNETLDPHNWKTKRYAYVITLADQWYDVNTDQVSDATWALADQSVDDFYCYQEIISRTMEATTPRPCQ